MGQIGEFVNNNLQHRTERSFQLAEPESGMEVDRVRLLDALEELHRLLEEYAPAWYTQEHHEKAEAALRGRHF